MERDIQVVGFRIGTETFGLPIGQVREIVRVPDITSVPNSPEHVEGVINLRGKIVPVVDLRKRFKEKNITSDRKNRVVVAEVDERLVGLLVNSATEVMRIPPSEIEAPNDLFQDSSVDYVTGVAKLKGRLVILLDLVKVLKLRENRRTTNFPETLAEFEESFAGKH
jgi:purine-binding chemotaxis protein CheW